MPYHHPSHHRSKFDVRPPAATTRPATAIVSPHSNAAHLYARVLAPHKMIPAIIHPQRTDLPERTTYAVILPGISDYEVSPAPLTARSRIRRMINGAPERRAPLDRTRYWLAWAHIDHYRHLPRHQSRGLAALSVDIRQKDTRAAKRHSRRSFVHWARTSSTATLGPSGLAAWRVRSRTCPHHYPGGSAPHARRQSTAPTIDIAPSSTRNDRPWTLHPRPRPSSRAARERPVAHPTQVQTLPPPAARGLG